MNSRSLFKSIQLCGRIRSMHSTPMSKPLSEAKVLPPPRILRLREKFQMDNGVPLYLKGGKLDLLLFLTTAGACVLGVCLSFKTIYDMSMPKKN
ncbi:hypothetical protein CHUAL_011333 [Chamberlinius hualienensis]